LSEREGKKCQIREKHAHRIFVNLVSYVRLESCGETSNCPNCRFYIRRRLQREEDALHIPRYNTHSHYTYVYIAHVWHNTYYLHTCTSTNINPRSIFIYLHVGEIRRVHFFGTPGGIARETFFTRVFVLTRRREIFLRESEHVPIFFSSGFCYQIFLSAFKSSSQNFVQFSSDKNREFMKFIKSADLSISFLLNYRYFSLGITIATQYRCAIIDVRMIRHSSNLHERPIIEANYPVDRLFRRIEWPGQHSSA